MRKNALTLIEVIIVACIFSLIAASLGSVFVSGVKLWQRAQVIGVSTSEILLGLEGISKNIRQSLELEDVGFVGKKTSFEFPTVIGGAIFKVVYSFDKVKEKLSVKKIKYEDVLAKRIKEPDAIEVFGADEVVFEYLTFETGDTSYSWKKEVEEKDKILAMVKIVVEKRDKIIEKLVFVPIGYGQK